MELLLNRLIPIRDALLENWKAKLGSLVVAIIFFYYVQYTKNVTRVVHVKVDPPIVPAGLVLNSRIPSFVKVEFSGPQDLMDFNPANFRMILVNPGPGPGENRYRLELIPRPPEGIEARFDEGMTVTLDRLFERTLPLVGEFQLTVPDLHIGFITMQPPTIRVSGPASVLQEMDRVNLNPVRITTGNPEFTTRALVGTLPEFVRLADDQPYEIDVRVRLLDSSYDASEKPEEGIFLRELPVNCENPIPGLRLDESPVVKVFYRGAKNLPEGRLSALAFCPVFLDPDTRNIFPSLRISEIPVYIKDGLMQKDVEILEVRPQVVNLQFSVQRIRQPTQVQKGMEEHLIR